MGTQTKRKEMAMILFMGIIVLLVHIWNIRDVWGIYMSEDELGYWASGAYFAGENWSDVMQYTAYYGFGYGFILAPLIRFINHPVTMYRAAILINALCMEGVYLLAYKCTRRLYERMRPVLCGMIGLTCALTPGAVAQSPIAWSECLLMFMVWLVFWLLLTMDEHTRCVRTFVTGLALMYCYMIHQRMLGMVIAGVLAVVLLRINGRIQRQQFLAFLAGLFIGIGFSVIIKKLLVASLYMREQLVNDYGTQTKKLAIENWPNILMTAAGQYFYLSVAGLLLLTMGFWSWIREILEATVRLIKEKQAFSAKTCFQIFAVLTLAFTLGISAIFMSVSISRIDHRFYGRYVEVVGGIFLIAGLGDLFNEKYKQYKQKTGVVIWTLICFVASGFMLYAAVYGQNMQGLPFQPSCAAAIYGLYYLWKGFRIWKIMGFVAGVFILVIISVYFSKHKYLHMVPTVFLCVFAVLCGKTAFYTDEYLYQRDTKNTVLALEQLKDQLQGEQVLYMDQTLGKGLDYRGLVKYIFHDYPPFDVVAILDEEGNIRNEVPMPEVVIAGNKVALPYQSGKTYITYHRDVKVNVLADLSRTVEGSDSQAELPIRLLYSGANARKSANTIETTGDEGYALWGPYWSVDAGEYFVEMDIQIQEAANDPAGYVDVTGNSGSVIMAKREFACSDKAENGVCHVQLSFINDQIIDDLEIRCYMYQGTRALITKVTIR